MENLSLLRQVVMLVIVSYCDFNRLIFSKPPENVKWCSTWFQLFFYYFVFGRNSVDVVTNLNRQATHFVFSYADYCKGHIAFMD